jgi:3-methyl-2-oxobutanoate hydroxymethyltransferase
MKTTADFRKMKSDGIPIAMMTAYDFPSAKLLEQSGIDILLVGDSLGNVVLGYDSTIPVTLDDIVLHTKAVKRGARDTFVVADMPFMTYHSTPSETLANAKRLVQEAGADAVKLEGAGIVLDMIKALTSAGAPVVAHLGLTPQSVGVLGGYKVQGKDVDEANKLIEDAEKVEAAGVFMLVLECVPHQLAGHISKKVNIPVIGIGAGADVDGQVLVYHDVMGYGVDRVPKFVKQYAQISSAISEGAAQYISEVKNRSFPSTEHTFKMKEETLSQLYGGTNK